jgi:hypothetical protein
VSVHASPCHCLCGPGSVPRFSTCPVSVLPRSTAPASVCFSPDSQCLHPCLSAQLVSVPPGLCAQGNQASVCASKLVPCLGSGSLSVLLKPVSSLAAQCSIRVLQARPNAHSLLLVSWHQASHSPNRPRPGHQVQVVQTSVCGSGLPRPAVQVRNSVQIMPSRLDMSVTAQSVQLCSGLCLISGSVPPDCTSVSTLCQCKSVVVFY